MFKRIFKNRFVFYVEYSRLDGYRPQVQGNGFRAALRFLYGCLDQPYYVEPVIVKQDTYKLPGVPFHYLKHNKYADRRIGTALPCQPLLRVLARVFFNLEIRLEVIHNRIFHKMEQDEYYYDEHPLFG